MAKKMEFYEGEEQQKRVATVMKALITAKAPKQARPERQPASAK